MVSRCIVFFGQGAVKLISGIVSAKGFSFDKEPIILAIALVIVVGLVPSLLVLTLVLVSEQPSRGLAVAQCILFFIGLAVFILFGWLGKVFSTDIEEGEMKEVK
jgi:hypothetical protein